jgi:tRNA (adenine37-N6)-methyltransferase
VEENFSLLKIGYVKSTIKEKVYENWSEIISEIHLDTKYIDGLTGLSDYSHAIIVFYMDNFQIEDLNVWKRKPRGLIDLTEVGVFAQRTKYRPNPIGITTVKIISIQDNIIIVQGLDANDNTPILDVKPYIPSFDRVESAKIPNWMDKLMKNYF